MRAVVCRGGNSSGVIRSFDARRGEVRVGESGVARGLVAD